MQQDPLTELLLSGTRYESHQGRTIQPFDSPNRVYMVESGYIKRYLISKDGSQSVQSIFGPGTLFPLTAVYKELFNLQLSQSKIEYFYGALTDVTYYALSIKTLHARVKANPEFYQYLMAQTGRRFVSNIQYIENMSYVTANRRIAHQLAYLANYFGEQTDQGIVVNIPLTQQDLSDILNLSRETVSRVMAGFRKRGMLAASQRLTITDLPRLEAVFN